MNTTKRLVHRLLILAGNSLTVIGCAVLVFNATGLMSEVTLFTDFSVGVRGVGAVAITGCLLSAIGYGIVDYLEE